MRYVLIICVILFGLWACDKEKEQFDMGVIHLNQMDSLAMVDIYNSTGGGKDWAVSWDLKDFKTWEHVSVKEIEGEYRIVSFQIADNPPYLPKGVLPESIGNFPELTSLYISSDEIKGKLPSSIGKLHKLKSLTISVTGLCELPPEIGKLQNLERLYLWYNEFDGPLPKELGELPIDTKIWIWYNKFSGTIPLEILDHNRTNISLDHNNIEELPWICWLSDDYGIPSLMYNRLSGLVPAEVLESPKWNQLNLMVRPQQEGYGYDVFKK